MRTQEPEVQQFVSHKPQPQPQVWCVRENLKFSNLSFKTPKPDSNPNTLPQPQPHVGLATAEITEIKFQLKNKNNFSFEII